MSKEREVVICEPLRTPVGRYGGALAQLTATELAVNVMKELAERLHLEQGDVDDVILGQCYPSGEAPAIGRVAALDAGLGTSVPGFQIDRRCGSGLQAVIDAVMRVQGGFATIVLAGGTESMSQVEHYTNGLRGRTNGNTVLFDRLGRARETAGGKNHPISGGMVETAENCRRHYAISRIEQDEFAALSHQKAVAAATAGRFTDEIIPVATRSRSGPTVVATDEHPRPGTTPESLAGLSPVLIRTDPESTVTAGNSSGQNDGAALCAVTTRAEAERRGWQPYLTLRSWAVSGVAPEMMGIGPVPAVEAALSRIRLTMADLGVIELNEAFAAQALACLKEWGIEMDDHRLNPNGSGISLGHPVGATGGRILATMAHELRRRDVSFGLETMCIGGGQGLAAVFELCR